MNAYVEFVQEEREWNRFVVEAIAIEEIEEDWGHNKIHTSATNSLCQFLVSTILALRRTSGIFISATIQIF
jgi:hypothetical protein